MPEGPVDGHQPALRGITLADWTADGYAGSSAQAQLSSISATGATHVVLLCTAYMSGKRENSIYLDGRTPTVASLTSCIREAQLHGLAVILKAHVNLDDGGWSAGIEPADPSAWFASYTPFVLQLAQLAQNENVDILFIGNELSGTLRHQALWQQHIVRVRAVYSGTLSYAATWDAADQVPFWELLDIAGVNFYGPVAGRKESSRFDILAGWQPWLNKLDQFRLRCKKPLMLSEIGYRSIDGAGREPADFRSSGPYDPAEQADLYWGALMAVAESPWIEGMIWWNWLSSGAGGNGDTDYTPLGKPALEELKNAWRAP